MATITVTPTQTFVSGNTVTPATLNQLAQSTVALTAGSIVAADIASDAVTNVKIASGVDASKLTTGTLPADRIGSNAITTARINDAAVTAAKQKARILVGGKWPPNSTWLWPLVWHCRCCKCLATARAHVAKVDCWL